MQTAAEENIITANNLGAFYRFVNRHITNHFHMLSLTTLTDSSAKANVFNSYFSSVGGVLMAA